MDVLPIVSVDVDQHDLSCAVGQAGVKAGHCNTTLASSIEQNTLNYQELLQRISSAVFTEALQQSAN